MLAVKIEYVLENDTVDTAIRPVKRLERGW
jgi:hypothetical protein